MKYDNESGFSRGVSSASRSRLVVGENVLLVETVLTIVCVGFRACHVAASGEIKETWNICLVGFGGCTKGLGIERISESKALGLRGKAAMGGLSKRLDLQNTSTCDFPKRER